MSPGCLLIQNPRFIKGQSTLLVDDVSLHTTVAGHVERTNRLLTVRPFRNASYHGEVGDVVVGRISNVAQKKWKVDIYAKLVSELMSNNACTSDKLSIMFEMMLKTGCNSEHQV